MTDSVAASPASLQLRRRDRGHARVGGDGALHALQSAGSLRARRQAGGEHERSVEAGAEALREPVVGLAGRGARPVVAVVGLAQSQARERRRQQHQHERAQPRGQPRARDDPATPAGEALRRGDVLRLARAQALGEHAHQHRQHRDGANRDGGDHDRRADAHAPDERDAGGEQARNRDDDNRTGSDHRRSCRRVGHARRAGHAVPRRELLSVAADDQQRVVDPGAHAEHQAECRRDAGEVDEAGAEREQHQPAGERDARAREGEQHRSRRAQHEREHDDRHREAYELADRHLGLLGLVDDRAVAVGLDARPPGDLRCVLERLARLRAEVGRRLVVLHGRERNPPVARDLAVALQRVRRRGDMRLAGDRPHRLGDRCRPVAVAQRPVLDREHDGRGVARLGGEALGEQVVGLLRIGARRIEVVAEAGAHCGEPRDRGERDDDEDEGALPMTGCGVGEVPE